jgi:hypothetical protein
MITDIIPIRFLGGTGGHFVDAWITEAKFRKLNLAYDKGYLSFSGNAHLFPKEFDEVIHNYTVSSTIEDHIDAILKVKPSSSCSYVPPYTLVTHIRDGNLLERYFDKVINISCEPDDAETIAKIFVVKNNKLSEKDLEERLQFTHYQMKNFYPSENPKVFNLFWKDLLNGDPYLLKEKLESYTAIPNLDVAFLTEWRNKTHNIIQ